MLYVDRGSGFLPYISWWLHAWKLSGLNTSSERFDLVLFTHPESGRVEDWGVRYLHKNGQNLLCVDSSFCSRFFQCKSQTNSDTSLIKWRF